MDFSKARWGVTDDKYVSKFNVLLITSGSDKVAMMKAVRAINPNQYTALKPAKDLIDNAPQYVIENVGYEEAAAAIKLIEQAGGTAEMQREINLDILDEN
jgi:large subunit ribosomal protein L7/L12